jgi:pyruvate,water dikinase
MPTLVIPFEAPGASLARAGGKGQNLASLAQAGFPVPPGYIITTAAYRDFVQSNQLQGRILERVHAIRPDDPADLEAAAGEIRALFASRDFPAVDAQSILASYEGLTAITQPGNAAHAAAVAVRSSATAKDLPGLSFAGQQETYLNVVGPQAVLAAVRDCWASLWTARAIAYRARSGIAPEDVALAVVVQQMIEAEASGVLFTANPLTGHRRQMVIDAAFGLGEAIVSGQVEPDHYVVDAATGAIVERKLGAKALAIVPRSGGGTEHVQRVDDKRAALPDDAVTALVRLAARVAEHFRVPQDIEWAWAGGRMYLLQARPITSLYPLPEVPVPEGAVGLYFSFGSVQGVPGPMTPIGREMIRVLLGGFLHRVVGLDVDPAAAIPEAGERLFLNFTEVGRDARLREGLLAFMRRADPLACQVLAHLIEAGRLPLKPGRKIGPPRFLFHLIPKFLPRLLAGQINPPRALSRAYAEAEAHIERVREQARGVAPNLAARLAFAEATLDAAFEPIAVAFIPAVFPAIAALTLLDRWLVPWCGLPPGSALVLARGLPGNVTTEMNLKLWDAARAIRADAESQAVLLERPAAELAAAYRNRALPAVALRELDLFLDAYGMRAVAEIDLGLPRWRDDPTGVLQTLQSYLSLTEASMAPDAVFRRSAEEAERLAADCLARARKVRPGLVGAVRARVLAFTIGRLRSLGGAREAPKFYMVKLFDTVRTILLAAGRELVERGELDAAEAIFFVPVDALRQRAGGQPVDLRGRALENRTAYAYESARRQMPRLLLSTGETFYGGASQAEAGAGDLVGEAVSPGVAEGVARVVLDPRGTRLEPGEILVCPATDPGWTPLFLAAGGLVMEIGGMVTHGSVVAREYGIPAVVGVAAATTRLRTGQRVQVDGNTGRVTVLG